MRKLEHLHQNLCEVYGKRTTLRFGVLGPGMGTGTGTFTGAKIRGMPSPGFRLSDDYEMPAAVLEVDSRGGRWPPGGTRVAAPGCIGFQTPSSLVDA